MLATRGAGFTAWTRHPLTALTGLVALVYGIGFALHWYGDPPAGALFWTGAAVTGVLFVSSIVAARRRR